MQKMVKNRLITLTPEQEAAQIAEWDANTATKVINDRQAKRIRLIEAEKQIALSAIIAPEIAAIEAMNDAALDIAIGNL